MNERIKMIREHFHLTMEKFGDRLGVTKAAISKLEKGERNVTEQMSKAICREFNINEEWIRTGEGEMFNITNDDYTKISVDIDKKDPKARQAIIDYWNLSEQDKELFWKFMNRFIQKDGGE